MRNHWKHQTAKKSISMTSLSYSSFLTFGAHFCGFAAVKQAQNSQFWELEAHSCVKKLLSIHPNAEKDKKMFVMLLMSPNPCFCTFAAPHVPKKPVTPVICAPCSFVGLKK